MAINVAEITSVLKREISQFEQKVQVSEVGTVIEVGDHSVTFTVEAHDGVDKIGEGTHTRAAVEISRFMRRVQTKRS